MSALGTKALVSGAPRDRALRWPVGLAATLGVVVAVNALLVWSALGDPSFVIEKDYHRRAIAFDGEAAAARASTALGWTAAMTLEAPPAGAGAVAVVTLRDAQGSPVLGASVTVTAFHNARAANVLGGVASLSGDGRYTTALALDRPGIWIFRVEATRGADRFLHEERRELGAAR